jgi:hypothetical protein
MADDSVTGKETTVAFVSKMFVGQDLFSASAAAAAAAASASSAASVSDTVFVGFCRVFSGTLSVGDELCVTPNITAEFLF